MLTLALSPDLAPATRDALEVVVAPMAHILTLSVEQTLASIAQVSSAQRRTFITLGKLIVHLQRSLPANGIGAALRARGISKSSLDNASHAARVWNHAVEPGLLTEEEFDELTFVQCLAICRALGGGRHLRADGVRLAIEAAGRADDLAPELSLDEAPGSVTVHPRGVRVTGTLSYQEWYDLLGRWKELEGGWHFGLADLLLYGRTHYGHADVDSAMGQLGFSRTDATTAAAIESVPTALRDRQEISADHIRAVAKAGANLPAKERERWLEKAADKELDPLELRRSITAGKVVRGNEAAQDTGRNSGVDTVEGIRFLFERWKRRVEGLEGPATTWDTERKQRLLSELSEIEDFCAVVRASLP